MYETVYVPVDNSPHSNRGVDTAVVLGERFGSRLVGCHVYAARMHDYRFKQMEYTLPEEYLEEQELHRQRKIHDSLITLGLELVSDCYLEDLAGKCEAAELDLERKMMDGKHSVELLRDIESSDYDLVVIGALGIGRTKDSQIGAVCAAVTSRADTDVWVVKHLPGADEPERDTILVGVDGSPKSFGALMTAIELAKRFDKRLEIVGVYDPYLHYAVFKGIVEVLTDRAAKVFRFEEQNQLHEEVIDTGLASIYQSHVNVAAKMAADEGLEATKTLLDGKAFQKMLDHARRVEPWVMVVGRNGIHNPEGETGLGSNAENLLRLASCDVLLTTSEVVPELDLKAEESIHWTPEAEERMGRVPPQVVGIARTAILRLAIEQGHSVVSSDLVTEAMERFMPKGAGASQRLAEALVQERAEVEPVAICEGCGMAARTADPATCTVCGGESFRTIEVAEIARVIAEEGGAVEEATYDGKRVRWTQESREALRLIGDNYQRRRAKARIEKSARMNRLEVIPFDFAKRFIEEEIGVIYRPAIEESGDGDSSSAAGTERASENGDHDSPEEADRDPDAPADADPDLRLVARDEQNNPLLSVHDYTEEAAGRLLRVPAGFMRDKTQRRIEELAEQRDVHSVDLELVEEGIEIGRQMMAEMLGNYTEDSESVRTEVADDSTARPDRPPRSAAASGGRDGSSPSPEAAGVSAGRRQDDDDDDEERAPALNEVGIMREMAERRGELARGSRSGSSQQDRGENLGLEEGPGS